MGDYSRVHTVSLSDVVHLCPQSLNEALDLDSSASYIVTDFANKTPQVIEKDVLIDDALYMMKMGHVRSKLVVDNNDNFLGIVSSSDLVSYKVLHIAQLRNQPRKDLTVENVMVKKDELYAIDFTKVSQISIGQVLETLKDLGNQHVLLIDQQKHLRGIISSTDIARALHIPVNINEKAHSFKEIFKVVYDKMCDKRFA